MTGKQDFNQAIEELLRKSQELISWDMENGLSEYPQEAPLPVNAGTEETSVPTAAIAPTAAIVPTAAIAPAPSSASTNPAEALEQLRLEIGDCIRCPLHVGRTKLVFGEGNPQARLVFVGEGPGRDEDLSGRPFVGKAGQLLDKIIGAIGLERSDVYICNIVKCRPPGNRDPEAEEASTCGHLVQRQLKIIQPEVVVALGKPAAHFLLNSTAPISKLRGRFHDFHGVKLMPTYHPAYLLRNPEGKRPVWEDMKQVRDALGRPTKTS